MIPQADDVEEFHLSHVDFYFQSFYKVMLTNHLILLDGIRTFCQEIFPRIVLTMNIYPCPYLLHLKSKRSTELSAYVLITNLNLKVSN